MADTLHFSLVSPERELFSGDVKQVDAPGVEGEFGVLPKHAPFMTVLKPGIVEVDETASKKARLFVRGGFADVSPAGLTILAEQAIPVEELDSNWQPTGTVQTIQRPRNRASVPSAATVTTNDAVVLPKLAKILEGKMESEYLQAIIASGDPEVGVQPYITEAGGNPSALTARLVAIGMRQLNGMLVN